MTTPDRPAFDPEIYARTDGPIHQWFGLSYANYGVFHRTLAQSMPVEWQDRMVACLTELGEAFTRIDQPQCFIVEAAVEREYDSLTDAEMAALGVIGPDEDDDAEPEWTDRDGHSHSGWERCAVPTTDPVPHYNRGRAYIAPREADRDHA